MPSYKLVYFNTKGRAEATRLLFAAAEVKFEDFRFKKDEWPAYKAKTKLPFGQVPVLEVDGKILAQSNAIFKYVARETGLTPTDNFEIGKADMICDGIDDVMVKAMKFYFEKDEAVKKPLIEEFYGTTLPVVLRQFENILNDSGGKYFAASKLTYADIKFFTAMDMLFQNVTEDIPPMLESFPALKALYSSVKSNPGIKKYLSERPAA